MYIQRTTLCNTNGIPGTTVTKYNDCIKYWYIFSLMFRDIEGYHRGVSQLRNSLRQSKIFPPKSAEPYGGTRRPRYTTPPRHVPPYLRLEIVAPAPSPSGFLLGVVLCPTRVSSVGVGVPRQEFGVFRLRPRRPLRLRLRLSPSGGINNATRKLVRYIRTPYFFWGQIARH